jgi:CelD/BcsL family acetyltransferase involved in cellulose biosynthesis
MRIVLHRDIPDDPLLEQEWNALVQEMERPEVFYTHQWALAVCRAYGESLLPILLLAYEGDKLAGLAALATDPAGKTASFLCSATADYCDLVSHPDRRAELLDAVVAELCRAGLPSIVFTSLPAESATISPLRSAARRHGYRLFVRPTSVCAQVDLGSQTERAALKTALGKKKIFRYSMNTLRREGPVSFNHLVTWEAIEPVLTCFSVAHVARFLAAGRISNIATAERRTFLYELARLLSRSGWVVLSRMLVADRPIAWNYGFQFQGSWFWYQPTFDTSYERLSPGYCLLSKIISEACDQTEMRVIDLGLGAEGYKERFANSTRTTLHATFTKSLERHAREIVRYHAARAVTFVPGAESAVRAVVRYIGRGRRRLEEGGRQGFSAKPTQRVASWLNRSEEIIFYQWRNDGPAQRPEVSSGGLSLRAVDLETLAVATIFYQNEPDTLSYLLGSARRLQPKTGQGFALLDRGITPVHFCWVDDFEGFEMKDLETRLSAPSQNAAIIFDCWTPQAKRGRGYFGIAISLLARHVAKAGKEPWIFSAINNPSCRHSIERAGFERRYSMICKKTLAWQRVSKVAFDGPAPAMEARAGS